MVARAREVVAAAASEDEIAAASSAEVITLPVNALRPATRVEVAVRALARKAAARAAAASSAVATTLHASALRALPEKATRVEARASASTGLRARNAASGTTADLDMLTSEELNL